jgi:hypothetical protein
MSSGSAIYSLDSGSLDYEYIRSGSSTELEHASWAAADAEAQMRI